MPNNKKRGDGVVDAVREAFPLCLVPRIRQRSRCACRSLHQTDIAPGFRKSPRLGALPASQPPYLTRKGPR